jgi:hypothetical protein
MPASQYLSLQVVFVLSGLVGVIALAILHVRSPGGRARVAMILFAVMILGAALACTGANPWGSRPVSVPAPANFSATASSIQATQTSLSATQTSISVTQTAMPSCP